MDNNTFNTNNNFGNYNGYGSYNFSSQPESNIIRVTSLEEAIMRTPNRPCDMVFFNQDKDEFYRVKVDYYGKKSWATFTFAVPNNEDTAPVTRSEFKQLVAKVEAMMSKQSTEGGAENG